MLIRRVSLGLLFAIVFLLTHGVAHSLPMGGSGTAGEQAIHVDDLMLGDLNEDGVISGLDFILFRGCYLDLGPECGTADIDGDQIVGLSDFGIFAVAYAGRPGVVAPEPGTLLLVAAGCTAIAVARRRSHTKRRECAR